MTSHRCVPSLLQIVDLMVRSVDRRSSDAFDTFALIAKAHGKIGRSHLTLHLCEAVQRRTGQPLVPSTPKGLVLLLEAMQPKVLRHVHKTADSVGGEREVQDVLRRYESEGKVRAKSRHALWFSSIRW